MNLAPAYADKSRLTEDTVTRYRDLMLAPGVRQALLERTAQVRLERPEPMLRRIQAPTLLVWGEKDAADPVQQRPGLPQRMPNARLVSFPNLGHVPQEEDPAQSLPPVEASLPTECTRIDPGSDDRATVRHITANWQDARLPNPTMPHTLRQIKRPGWPRHPC